MIRTIYFLLIAAGGIIMIISSFIYQKLFQITYRSSEIPVYSKKIIYTEKTLLKCFQTITVNTTKRFRALNIDKAKRVPIIAMTANAYKEDVEKAIKNGMNARL